jgi:dipeptidyl aminopeptidase/acylaminoacyl peptidase
MSLIIKRELINLTPLQEKMIISGWGKEAFENSIVEKIVYLSDGLKIHGFIAHPANLKDTKFPCVIWNRGGVGQSGAIDDFNARGIFGQLASWGYVALASQYRGNAGSEGMDEFGGGDVNDVLSLIPLASEIPEADTKIWGIEGWSRGGMMTYLALTRNHNFKAAVVSGAISNLNCEADDSPFSKLFNKEIIGFELSSGFKKKCFERSIINFPDKLSKHTPILILHGTNDERVSPDNSIELSKKLIENKIHFRLVLLEGGDHFLKKHRKEVDEMRRNWFKKYLV